MVHQLISVFVHLSRNLKIRHLVQISKKLNIFVITLIFEVNSLIDESFNKVWFNELVEFFQTVFTLLKET